MRRPCLSLLPLASLLLAACAGGGPSSPPSAAAPSGAPPSGVATRVEVTLTDAFRIEPAQMTVPMGAPVTFVVTNTGALDHEFYLGDEEAQAEHEREMQAMSGGMPHDEPEGITVPPGQTKELTYTFGAAGATLAGCHLPGHYAAGMKADISVAE